MLKYERFYSTNAKGLSRSEIVDLLKLSSKPGVISFAGGLPAPDLFPVEDVKEITDYILEKEGRTALQYGPTEGSTRLREELLKFMAKEGVHLSLEQLLIITSSQQGLDLVSRVFLDPGDIVLCGRPTYIGALQVFHSCGACLRGVELEEDGISITGLEREIKHLAGSGKRPKFIYVVPDFQNPSGITLSLEKRRALIDLAETHDLVIVEDSPYRQLRFAGEPQPPLIGLNNERVVAIHTFSKILLPGFRLGWMAGPPEIIQKAIFFKQGMDVCAPPFNQAILAEMMSRGLLEKQINRIIGVYKEKRDFMLQCLGKYMAGIKGIKWTRPEGGLFLWVTLPDGLDAVQMLTKALEKNVAYVVGSAFDPDGLDRRTFRMNFSFSTMEQIDRGVQRLAEVIGESLERENG